MSDLIWKFATCNVWGINIFVKQIKDKYDGVRIFTSGLDIKYLGAGIAVVMNNSLACHVSKVEVGKLLVSVFGLYIGASAGIHFEQTSEVNSIIAKALNTSTFMVLGGDFNECRSQYCGNIGQSERAPRCSIE
ncbi:hypothetical protein G9A89_000165 [Geosiphon pyriformis]|nr:hypothetical protein G9A89_000165 [Geosiphon pyriformis]